jgi:Predicted periplasmic lipoprotein
MKTIVLFLAISTYCNAQLIQQDKVLHFGAGAVIGSATYTVVFDYTKDKRKAFLACFISSVIAGTAKEILDSKKQNNKFNTRDLNATILGGLSAGITINIFNK